MINFHSLKEDILTSDVPFKTLDFILKNPHLLSEMCYELRVMISPNEVELVPKSFFANLLGCQVKELAQIESGYIYNYPLAYRYYFALVNLYNNYKTFSLI